MSITFAMVFWGFLFTLGLIVALGGLVLFLMGKAAWDFFLETFDKIHGR